jgi:hypothetical protein
MKFGTDVTSKIVQLLQFGLLTLQDVSKLFSEIEVEVDEKTGLLKLNDEYALKSQTEIESLLEQHDKDTGEN